MYLERGRVKGITWKIQKIFKQWKWPKKRKKRERVHSKGGKHAECYFLFMLWKHLCIPGLDPASQPWDLGPDPEWQQLSFSKRWLAAFAASLLQCHLLQRPERSWAGDRLSRQRLGCTSAEPPRCRHLPNVQEDREPLSLCSYPFGQTRWPRWLTPWPVAEPLMHPGAGTRMRGGHCPELPPLGPPQVLTPWSHMHPHGPFLTTDALFRHRRKDSHYRFFYISPEIWWLWLFPLFPTPRVHPGSPWRLCRRSQ